MKHIEKCVGDNYIDKTLEYNDKLTEEDRQALISLNLSKRPDDAPNNPKAYIWATFIPSRRPQFKVHETKGQATAAIKYQSIYDDDGMYRIPEDIILYQQQDAEWVEVPFKKNYKDSESIL